MMIQGIRTIFVRTIFVGFHCWQGAPLEVKFLRNEHRHRFFVEVEFGVSTVDRDIEYFVALSWVDRAIENLYAESGFRMGGKSCESICDELAAELVYEMKLNSLKSVAVFEDGENGSKLYIGE